jgi:hypothetical protein
VLNFCVYIEHVSDPNNIIKLKSVDNLSLYFNFKEKFKNVICYFDFLLKKKTKNGDFSTGKNSLTT